MKMVKSLLLGTAAGLVAMSGAQAADLPVKAKPVQYVKICSLYGAGFYYIPGTDTCIKLGGWVRTEYNYEAGGSFLQIKANGFDRNTAQNAWRTRGIITLDTRTQTDYGTLRSYIAGGFQHTETGQNNGDYGGPSVYTPRAFIQLGGFTAGLAQSFYDFYSTPAYSNTTNILGADTGGGGDNVFAYTAQFGNGLSASLSVEDDSQRRTGITGNGVLGGAYAATSVPDLVANLNVAQTWGSAQVMGALHQVQAGYYTSAVPGSGHPGNEVGFAVGAGLTVNLPMLGRGDTLSGEVDYTEGAMNYMGNHIGNFVLTQGASVGQGSAYDAVYGAAGSGLNLTKAWSVVGGFKHVWTSQWNTTAYGAYGAVNYDEAAIGMTPAKGSADWNFWYVGSRTTWSPVANLDLSVDVMYNKLNTANAIVTGGSAAAGFGTAVVNPTNVDWFQAMFRVQRNFYP